ncbi:hypothetical protein TWF481_006710 [Arthrobotrys musiformis]|uniref:Uncharacterized protein n=1 Tax=Arthrobotrys musiformis TaxID=47236 RepID=A0AAV9WB70_9PEZI
MIDAKIIRTIVQYWSLNEDQDGAVPPPTPGTTTLTNVYIGADLSSGDIATFTTPIPPYIVKSGQNPITNPWPQVSFTFTYIGINGSPPGPYSSSVNRSFSNDAVRFDGPFFDGAGDAYIKPTIMPGIGGQQAEGTAEAQAETSSGKQPEYDEATDFKIVVWSKLTDEGLACGERQLNKALEDFKDNPQALEIVKRIFVDFNKEKEAREGRGKLRRLTLSQSSIDEF